MTVRKIGITVGVIGLLFLGISPADAQLGGFLKDLGVTQNKTKTYDVPQADLSSDQCSKDARRNKAIGGIVGGVAGGLIGRELGGDDELVGTALGAAGGALIGVAIAGELTACDKELVEISRRDALETGQPVTWSNAESGNHGGWDVASDVQAENCRVVTPMIGGEAAESYRMCKTKSGSWSRA